MSCNCSWQNPDIFRPIDDFIPDVITKVNSVPDEVAANEIRNAAIEFSRRALLLRRTACMDAQANVADYYPELPDDYAVHSVVGVTLDGVSYRGCTTGASLRAECGGVFSYDAYNGAVVLDPPPARDSIGCLCVEVVVRPGQESCQLPAELYDGYVNDIAAGAAANLLLMRDTPWLDRTSAGIYRGIFSNAINHATTLAMRGGVAGPIFMKARRFI